MLKKVTIRICALLLLFGGLNLIYNHTFYEKDMRAFAPEDLRIKQSNDSCDVYYFGESSNVTYKPDDSTKASISTLCQLFYPNLKIININKYATHAGIYKYWLKQIPIHQKKPKAVIVTMNLRSFDAAWIHSKLETSLQQSLVMSKPYPHLINRFILALQAFDNKTEEQREKEMLDEWKSVPLKFVTPFKYKTVREWDDAMANGGYTLPDGTWDTKKIELACHYIKAYAFNLNAENPRVKDFDDIAEWCQHNGVKLYLNLLAENISYADSLVGKELVFLMRQNRDFLKQRYQNNNCVFVDNLERVNGLDFIDQQWTTEHYNAKGRMLVAKALAEALKTQFNESYIKAY